MQEELSHSDVTRRTWDKDKYARLAKERFKKDDGVCVCVCVITAAGVCVWTFIAVHLYRENHASKDGTAKTSR